MRQDAIVVGAGTAGCTAARILAEKGLSVCLLDVKRREAVGEKVCGDAIAKHHFDTLGLDYPVGEELLCNVEGVSMQSPDQQTTLNVRGEGVTGFMISRHNFGQRLLNDAMRGGATLLDHTRVLEPMFGGESVVGVKVKDMASSQVREIEAPITIDASGLAAVLRSKMAPESHVESSIRDEDVIVAYREIRSGVHFDSGLCRIFLSQEIAPGGYYWIFDRGHGEVNVGLGVQMKTGHPNPKEQLYKHVLSQEIFGKSMTVHGGGGIVPTRRPLSTLVADGIMFVGDTACLVNPIHGGGIGPSMLSGKLGAEVASEAVETGDCSRTVLWNYNVSYMRRYGAKQAALDVFRRFLQSLSDEDLNFGMRNRLITEGDLLRASMEGEVRLSITDKAGRAVRGIGRLRLLNRLRRTEEMMRTARQLYLEYPSPKEFASWRSRVDSIFAEQIQAQ